MDQSLIDIISGNNIRIYCEEWRNGRKGAIVLVDGKFRFIEMKRDSHGIIDDVHGNMNDNPVVAVGIVAYWLMYKSGKHHFITRLAGVTTTISPIKELFEYYTNLYFNQFFHIHSNDPNTWNWDWEYEYYAKYIIPHEIYLNKISEALFDYISDEDIKLVRSVMSNYIDYLKHVRSEKGYKHVPELKVLRAIEVQDEYMLEDLEDIEVNTIIDKLEKEGYIKVAWVEGHGAEDVRLLDKGKAYLKQLEKVECGLGSNTSKLPDVLNTDLARSVFAKCIENRWMQETDSGYHWIGISECRGRSAQLAYLCGKIYGFKYDGVGGNIGNEFPDEALCILFNEKDIYKSLVQVYSANKPQKWRNVIDNLF